MINTFPERLRAMREAKNLSRGDLAQLAALGEDALAHIERGSTQGTVNLLIARSTSKAGEIEPPGGRRASPPVKGRP